MSRDEGGLNTATIERMLNVARDAVTRAHVLYTRYPVAAPVLTASAEVVPGANIENASYGLTICGERVAAGHRELRAVAVSAPKSPGTTPCDACWQLLIEFKGAGGDMQVILNDGAGAEPKIVPFVGFSPDEFGIYDLKVSGQD